MFAVCRALWDLSEHAFCLLHISIATLRGRSPYPPFPPQIRAVRRCRCLKPVCGIKWGLGWFRHTKGRLLYLKSTSRVRPLLQLATVLRGSSSESWETANRNPEEDDSHRVKSRCVPGDFLSWFVPTKVFHSCPHQWSLSEKLQIQHWRRCAVRLNTSQLSCQLGSWSKMQSNISRSHPVCSISVDLSQLTKLRAYGIQKELQFSKKSLESWMCYPSERNYITTCHKMMPVSECCGLIALYAIPSTSSSFPHIRFWRWPSAKSNKSKMSGISE